MVTNVVNDVELMRVKEPNHEEYVGCSVGIMAYNEEANIERTLRAVLAQQGPSIRIEEVIVVASGCTDRTVPIVTELAQQEQRVHLYVQEKRVGKASAINLFLKKATNHVAVLLSATSILYTHPLNDLR